MKIEFLKREDKNSRLILVMAGWSADAAIARDISREGWDVAVVYDFSELSLDTSFLDRYYTVYVFAWSLGVFAASRVLPAERITAAFAINGTLSPADDRCGIPQAIFKGTADGLTARNLLKFRMRMTKGREEWNRIRGLFDPADDPEVIENLRRQLYNVMESCIGDATFNQLPWTRAYVCREDRIFPAANQKEAWRRDPEVEIVETDGGHYADISNIVNMVIADLRKVSEKFSKASGSYDTHAIAQYSAAIRLAARFMEMAPRKNGRLLEIGCGTGLFTREYSREIRPESATFVDITETGPFGISENESYFVEDAERWIEKSAEKWDMIVSASCIQWFADIPRFLHQCHEHLTEGGVIALSTFLPGNMEELDELRPSPLLYPRADQLKGWLSRDFEDVRVVEDCIRVEFKSAREVLMHLKHTGVGGSAPTGGLSMSSMSHLRSLTYRPVYITARRQRN